MPDRLEDRFRRKRMLGKGHAERFERVLDRGDDAGRGRNGTALALALDADRIERRRVFQMRDLTRVIALGQHGRDLGQ